jgi:hypothetical protein
MNGILTCIYQSGKSSSRGRISRGPLRRTQQEVSTSNAVWLGEFRGLVDARFRYFFTCRWRYDSILSISESRLNVYNTSLAADVYIRLTLPGTNNMRI